MNNDYTIVGDEVHIWINRHTGGPIMVKMDLADLPKLGQIRRICHQCGRSQKAYAVAYGYNNKAVMLGRLLNETKPHERCVFKTADSFDCRRANMENTPSRKLRFKSWNKKNHPDRYIQKRHPWIVRVTVDGADHYVGGFWNIQAARTARDAYLKKLGVE
jgi:hypothetical protein